MSFFSCGLQVRVCDGPDKGRTFPLDSREVTIGRSRAPGDRAPGWVLLNDPRISRIHADLIWSEPDKGYRLVHRSDTNPTEINGHPANDQVIRVGDIITVGGSRLDIQQADFRFGGVEPERIGQIHEARRSGTLQVNNEFAYRDPKREGEAHGSTQKASRKIALSTRPKLYLEVLGGNQKGQKLPLTGFSIQMGGPLSGDPPEVGAPWWDQEVLIDDAVLPYRCLSWHWRELQNAFEVALIREIPVPITLERRVDGTEWIAELPAQMGASVLIRHGDLFYVGKTALQLLGDES